MSKVEEIESQMIKMGLPYESVGDGTWLVQPDAAHDAQIGVQVEEPIVLFSIRLFDLEPETKDREGLFRRLLELNSELLHSAYSLQGERVVLSGAQQLANLDDNEFQAMMDDMTMAMANHYEQLAPWVRSGAEPSVEGSA